MKPSNKLRLKALRFSSPNYMKKVWLLLSCILFPVLAVVFLMIPLPGKVKAMMIIDLAVFMTLLTVAAFLIIGKVSKMLISGLKIPEQVSQNRLSRDQLMQDALNIGAGVPWTAEIHPDEGWIDVTWKWKESIDINSSSASQNEEVFYKLFRIHDDFTYEDLDYTTSKTSALYPGGAGMSKGFFLGRVKKKVYRTNISHNAAEGPSARQYMIDTDELANFMHQWFADRGYRYRGV